VTTTLIEWGSLAALAAVAQWIIVYTLLEPWWRRFRGGAAGPGGGGRGGRLRGWVRAQGLPDDDGA